MEVNLQLKLDLVSKLDPWLLRGSALQLVTGSHSLQSVQAC